MHTHRETCAITDTHVDTQTHICIDTQICMPTHTCTGRHAGSHTCVHTAEGATQGEEALSVRKAKRGRRFEMKMGHDGHQHLSVTAAHHSGVRGLDPSLD